MTWPSHQDEATPVPSEEANQDEAQITSTDVTPEGLGNTQEPGSSDKSDEPSGSDCERDLGEEPESEDDPEADQIFMDNLTSGLVEDYEDYED